jgi:hypothetical protein
MTCMLTAKFRAGLLASVGMSSEKRAMARVTNDSTDAMPAMSAANSVAQSI